MGPRLPGAPEVTLSEPVEPEINHSHPSKGCPRAAIVARAIWAAARRLHLSLRSRSASRDGLGIGGRTLRVCTIGWGVNLNAGQGRGRRCCVLTPVSQDSTAPQRPRGHPPPAPVSSVPTSFPVLGPYLFWPEGLGTVRNRLVESS